MFLSEGYLVEDLHDIIQLGLLSFFFYSFTRIKLFNNEPTMLWHNDFTLNVFIKSFFFNGFQRITYKMFFKKHYNNFSIV